MDEAILYACIYSGIASYIMYNRQKTYIHLSVVPSFLRKVLNVVMNLWSEGTATWKLLDQSQA